MAEEDLIFGKNRHLFGGIEPSNMLKFTASFNKVSDSANVIIDAQLPNDTVINGQTLCTVAGAIIRKKTTNFPVDEFDGDIVATITGSATINDSNVLANGTYYYSVFPFTAQGVYNRNAANRVVVNEPANMAAFSAKSVYESSTGTVKVEITANLPSGLAGAIICRSTDGFPVDENYGTAFKTITTDGVYMDTNVTIGVTYYYSAFPYTSTGAYNRNPANRTSCIPSRYQYFFGCDIDLNNSNPAARVTYPSDVDNAAYAKAAMNFSSNTFSYGGWPGTPGSKFMPKPCMLTYAGVVDHYLNPNDYTKRENGGTSEVANVSFIGNAMMEWPKIFTKRWVEGTVYKFRCCDVQLDSSYECWCNYDRQNHQIDHFYTPIYFGSSLSGKMRSVSGQANSVSTTADAEIAAARANGNDWYTEVLADRLLIQDLLVMMGKSTALQETFGSGVCSVSAAIGQGTMNTKGLFWGEDDKSSGVKVFGMENWWGNIFRRTAGWIVDNGVQKVKITRGTKDGSTASDYNTTGSGYKSISGSTPGGTNGGYISSMKTESFGRLPITASGSSSTYETDGLYFNNSGVFYAIVGGNYGYVLLCGPFCAYLSYLASSTSTSFGAALSCKPLAS